MTTSTDIETTPSAWIGCLACYNNGRLVGAWFDAETADTVTLADVHDGANHVRRDCEEMWVLDHENIPTKGEMSPSEAAEWGRVIVSVPERDRPALCAWVASGDYIAEGAGDIPSVNDFEERYAGHWDSFRDYAVDFAEDIGLLNDAPETLATYFDWDAWARDLAMDYTTVAAGGGCGVYVFRAL
ncbi:antirestriction protein ArdA [Leucobacter sp. cx-169]|uniref:antirestriction protein ArdA n=1 Tax=Leucobacter sp. cx-169 TaxID=2770549 RepID=UPI00165DB893|nr:antirestriction protein ArdA [Leucobacter sp. cx-169]MBC9927232.1 antirestriction protein ArdA [Leucobacter sp. cx-169]